jgi:hypothetical protein
MRRVILAGLIVTAAAAAVVAYETSTSRHADRRFGAVVRCIHKAGLATYFNHDDGVEHETGDPDAALLLGGSDIQVHPPGRTITVYRPGHLGESFDTKPVIRVPDDGSRMGYDSPVFMGDGERVMLDACIAAAE